MNRGRAYANRFIKQWQQQLVDKTHTSNLQTIKYLRPRVRDHHHTITISHKKAEMFKQERQIQIQRQNKALMKRMGNIIKVQGEYSVSKTRTSTNRANRSLNQIFRRKQQATIQQQNKRFQSRVGHRKATVDIKKLNKDWQDNQGVIKRMANNQFYLTNLYALKSQCSPRSMSRQENPQRISKMEKPRSRLEDIREKELPVIEKINKRKMVKSDMNDSRKEKTDRLEKSQKLVKKQSVEMKQEKEKEKSVEKDALQYAKGQQLEQVQFEQYVAQQPQADPQPQKPQQKPQAILPQQPQTMIVLEQQQGNYIQDA